jgi:methylthioribose-1-phosphate isomerase
VRLLDQRLLPGQEIFLDCRNAEEVQDAIRGMAVRGAPAIGVTAAMGIALGAAQLAERGDGAAFDAGFKRMLDGFAATRPTAVNLFWAIERMRGVARAHRESGPAAVAKALVAEAAAIKSEDIASCRRIGALGAELVPDDATILTHCNAGALATAGYGTALGVVRGAVEAGKRVAVFADETRPFLQGARLTAWELQKDGIPVTIITDGMGGHFLRAGRIDLVVVGADRIAMNGDVANKIGTYSVAVLAHENNVPFYVAAPLSTVDPGVADGEQIPIEERDAEEVTHLGSARIAPAGVPALHPAFDVTPHRYITAIVTDRGIARPPYERTLRSLLSA